MFALALGFHVFGNLNQQWREFKKGRPGNRFQERYERNRRLRKSKSWLSRFLQPIIGIVLLVVGVFFVIMPGPGIPFLLMGAGLLAKESPALARVLDFLEVRIRRFLGWLSNQWGHTPLGTKRLLILLGVAVIGGAGYGAYQIFLGT